MRTSIHFCTMAMAAGMILLAGGAVAATRTWTGQAGDVKWSTPGNWSDNQPPGDGDTAKFTTKVEFHSDVTLPSNITINITKSRIRLARKVSGGGGRIVKTGPGDLWLFGKRSDFSGTIEVAQGIVYAESIANIGETSALGRPVDEDDSWIVLSGGNLCIWGNGEFETDRSLAMYEEHMMIASNNTVTITGEIPYSYNNTAANANFGGSGTFTVHSKLGHPAARWPRTVSHKGTGALTVCGDGQNYFIANMLEGTWRTPVLADMNIKSQIGSTDSVIIGTSADGTPGCLSYYGSDDAHCDRKIVMTNHAGRCSAKLKCETPGTLATFSGLITAAAYDGGAGAMPVLYLDGAGDGALDMKLPANLSVVKEGSGTWSINYKNNSATGTVQVKEGTLNLKGQLPSVESCTVFPGAAICGSGSVSNLVLESGAHVLVSTSGTVSVSRLLGTGTVYVDVPESMPEAGYEVLTWTEGTAPAFVLSAGAPSWARVFRLDNALMLYSVNSTATAVDGAFMPYILREDVSNAVVAAAAKPHPRLFADAAEFAAMSNSLPRPVQHAHLAPGPGRTLFARAAARVYCAATRYTGSDIPPVQYDPNVRNSQNIFQKSLNYMLASAMSYRLYGNARHLNRALAELRQVCGTEFPHWFPNSFLALGEISLGVAIAYDLLYEYMDAETRTLVSTALREKALEPSRNPEYSRNVLRKVGNWGQICNAGMLAAALATAEEDPVRCTAYVQRFVDSMPTVLKTMAPNGGFPEGPGYWVFGTDKNAPAFAMLEHATGSDFGLVDLPGFRKEAEYLDYMTGPGEKVFNYSDSAHYRGFSIARWWFAKRFARPELLKYRDEAMIEKEIDVTPKDYKFYDGSRLFPLVLFWLQEPVESAEPPLPLLWDSQGPEPPPNYQYVPVAVQRSSWNDSIAMYAGLKGGSPAAGHAHMDSGSFVLDALGRRWAEDLGTQGYYSVDDSADKTQDSERWTVNSWNSFGHNILMIDGCQQNVKGVGYITSVVSNGNFTSVTLNLDGLYTNAASVTRTGTMASDGRSYVLHDTLTGLREGASVRWAMNTMADVGFRGNTAFLRRDGYRFNVTKTGADEGVWEVHPAGGTNEWDIQITGYRQMTFTLQAPASGELDFEVRFEVPEKSYVPVRSSITIQ